MDRHRGFTLAELVFTLAIVAGLLGWGLPTFRDVHRNAERTREVNQLVHDPDKASDCDTSSLAFPARSERGLYSLRVSSADASGWTAQARPMGPPQSADRACQGFGLAGTGRRSARDAAGRDSVVECWGR